MAFDPALRVQQAPSTPNNGRRIPKLRSSCDSCSSAKVRCDQEHPSCRRCLNGRIRCVYSISRRMGKPPNSARKRNQEGAMKAVARTTPSTPTTKAISNCEQQPLPTTTPISTPLCSSNGDFSPQRHHQTPDISTSRIVTDFGSGNYGTSDVESNGLNYIPDTFTSGSSEMSQLEHLSFPTHMSSSMDGIIDFLDSNGSFHGNPEMDSGRERMHDGRDTLGFNILDPAINFSDSIAPTERHHNPIACVNLTAATLHRLSVPFSTCATCPSYNPLSTVDKVLDTCRQAMVDFRRLLGCPCSQLGSSAISLSLILIKVLECYCGIACYSGSIRSPCGPLMSTEMIRERIHQQILPSPSLSPQSLDSSSFQNLVLGTPISIGAYKLDVDDEHIFILQLLLSEIRKVSNMAKALTAQCSVTAPNLNRNSEAAASRAEEALLSTLEQFLRAKIHSTKRDVSAALLKSEDSGIDFGSC